MFGLGGSYLARIKQKPFKQKDSNGEMSMVHEINLSTVSNVLKINYWKLKPSVAIYMFVNLRQISFRSTDGVYQYWHIMHGSQHKAELRCRNV